jgi:hypothetical protein
VLAFGVPFLTVYELILQRVGVGQGQKQTGKKFATPRKPALGKRLVSKTLEQRYELVLVLQYLLQPRQFTSSRVCPTYCFAITVLPVRCLEKRLN